MSHLRGEFMAKVLQVAWCLVLLCWLTLYSPLAMLAAESLGSRSCGGVLRRTGQAAVLDVRLSGQGSLDGRVVEAGDRPLSGETVVLWKGGRRLAEVSTDGRGRFSFAGLSGGVYEVVGPGHYGAYRVWSSEAAPPAARAGLLIRRRLPLFRGQHDWTPWFSKQGVVSAAMIGGAVAAPIAVINQRRTGS